MEKIIHTIDPVYDENSRVLLLGSMPSPKSREAGFYYGNPHNRFWTVLSAVFNDDSLAVKLADIRQSFHQYFCCI